MTAQPSLIPEIEAALKRGSPKRRLETLGRITDLFLDGAERLSEEQVALFDDVIGWLIVEIETKALADVAKRLAPVANAPAAVVRSLARHDNIAVAGPLLQQSKRRPHRHRKLPGPRTSDRDLAPRRGGRGGHRRARPPRRP
jgi:uncharacterized protein (DUF2336 family)